MDETGFSAKGPKQLGVDIIDEQGNVIDHVEYGKGGVTGITGEPVYQKEDGSYTVDPIDAAKFSIRTSDGAVEFKGPQFLFDLPEFDQVFDPDTMRQYSKAFRENPNARLPYMELKEDGTTEETQVTLPEFVDKLNSSLNNFVSNYRNAEAKRAEYRSKYGEKANNLSLTHIAQISGANANAERVYLPEFLFGLDTAFSELKGKRDADGSVSKDEFMEVYNRANVDQADMVAIKAALEGQLTGSDWGAESVTLTNGEELKNSGSASEAMRALALKNFIESVDPDSEWWQKVGDGAVTLAVNAAKSFNDVFVLNPASFAVELLPGDKNPVLDYTEDVNEAFSTWNQERMLIQDSTAAVATLGQIGGMLAGTVAQTALVGAVTKGISGAYAGALAKSAAAREAILSMGPSAQAALTSETMAAITNLSLGVRVVLASASAVEKVAWAVGLYRKFMTSHKAFNAVTALLVDTVHDAIMYDAPTLIHVLRDSDDEEAKNYWLSQLVDNSKWWVGSAVARGVFRFAGRTRFGQLVNARSAQFINKVSASIGDKKQAIKDYFYGGDVVRTLEKQINNTPVGSAKHRRLVNKLTQIELNEQLRKARRAFGDAQLETSGLGLSEEGLKQYRKATNSIRQIELAIDHYTQNAIWKQMEMLGLTRDPATGRNIYVNPELGLANATTTKAYTKLLEFTQVHKMATGEHSQLGQDLVDYMMGTQDLRINTAIREAGGAHAADAAQNIPIIEANLAALREKLPAEVVAFLESDAIRDYTAFYARLNDYGKSKGLVDVETITSYENNPIWRDNGYMPVHKERVDGQKWVPADGRYQAQLQMDIEHLTYQTQPGQHYVDPELVRQQYINKMAKTELNTELFKAFRSVEDATHKIIVSGEDSQRVKNAKANMESLEKATADFGQEISKQTAFSFTPTKRRKPIKNETFDMATRSEAISTFSLSETTQILTDKKVLSRGRTRLSDMVTAENYNSWFDGQTASVQNYIKQAYASGMAGSAYTEGGNNFEMFRQAVLNGGTDFEAGLQRAYLVGDEAFSKSSILNRAIDNLTSGKQAFAEGFIKERSKAYLKNIQYIDPNEVVDQVYDSLSRGVDEYVASVLEDAGAMKAIGALAGDAENGAELAGKYIALKNLRNDKEAKQAFWEEVEKALKKKGLGLDDADTIHRQVDQMWDDFVKAEYNDATQALRTVNPDLVDNGNVYQEVESLAKTIQGAQSGTDPNVIMYLDDQGRQVYAEVDPNFASLYNYRYQMTKPEASVMAKINAAMSKMFRLGTTTLNLKSFGNQLFKDTGNALVVGGAWQTIKTNADEMVDVFGRDVIEQIKRFDPTGYEMRQVEAIAEQTGQSLEEAAISRELARGAAVSPATTETVLYRQFMKDAYADSDGMLSGLSNKLEGFVDSVDNMMNGKRETYLRNRVYANNLNRALSEGYDLYQARNFATFAMNNATTNFSRQLYHMQAIADSTPYFRAAINGTKSFWRMWSLDPVGITGRMMGGLVLPTIFLTGASLGDPDNRELYRNIPEYQKADNMIFVVDKQVISIPIPQEMANFTAPFRQFVEYLYDANPNDFWELMMNDVLGFSPVDLTAYTTVDMDKMIQDPTLGDRISRGTARIFSQMAPVPLKSAYMLATGTDPYSGKRLVDASYTYWNSSTNDFETMDYSQNRFAKAIADMFGKVTGNKQSAFASPAILEKVVSGTIGSTGSEILGSITALFTEGAATAVSELGEGMVEQATSPFSVEVYNQADAVWKRAIRELTAEKDAIIASDEYQSVYRQLAQETDETARKKLMATGQNLLNDFQTKVAETVKRLSSVYGGTFDKKKFGAVVNLLNFNSDATYQSGTQLSKNISSDAYYEGRNMAIATMEALGVNGTNDMSIFGYLVTDKDGKSVMKYATPTAIMEMENVWYSASDIDVANVEAKLKQDGIKKQEMWDGYYAAKAQGKDALKAYKQNWNARVVKSLAPYISERGVESVMSNSQTRDLLDNYLFVDNLYQTKEYLLKIFGDD